jgi:glyoxylase-like metal-dependent hydrolase (beta-lactamase superfamily II)
MTPLQLLPLECGWLKTDRSNLASGATGDARLPIPSWLVKHPTGGTLLFDTGMHQALQKDMSRYPTLSFFEPEYDQGEEVSARVQGVDVDPDDVDIIVFSHLHFDHCGGTGLIPNARIVVQQGEWQAGHRGQLIEAGVYNPDDFDLGHDVQQIEGEHDVFGDGSVLCIPTPGHTEGHQSLRVNLESGPVVLTADCVYWKELLDEMRLPPFGFDSDQQLASMRHLAALRDDHGCRLLFGHDADQWASLPHDGSGLT